MTAKRSIRGFALALGGLLVGLPAATALAAEPTTAAEARALAQDACDLADQYRAMGGIGYSTGRVQEAEAQAARYDELAKQLAAPPAPAPVMSPEAQHYADRIKHFQAMGGVAYKTGLIRWAEADQQKAEADQQKAESAAASTAGAKSTQTAPCD